MERKNYYIILLIIFIILIFYKFIKKQINYFIKKIYIKKRIKKEIIIGLKNKEFKIYIQPKYNTETEIICGGEVLVRWEKNKKIIYPNQFINKFEKSNLINKLDIYLLKEICKKLEEWNKKEFKKIKISINQSQKNLLKRNYINKIKKIINKYKFEKNLLEIELTESIFIENKEKVKKLEKELHELGVLVSIDDFGTGYSSYYLLSEINIDILKLDKNLFKNLENKKTKIIVNAIVNMAKKLKIKTIAEGIETIEQLNFIKEIKCDEIQGYYFSKAIKIEEFENKMN